MVAILFSHATALIAAGITHNGRIQLTSIWGETSFLTTFEEGASSLEWPMDMQLIGAAYTIHFTDIAEIEVALKTSPWINNKSPMKDFDWINESRYQSRAPHEGIDIYSESSVDSKAFMYDSTLRVYPVRLPFASLGFLLAYQNQEMDFRAFNTRQVGFGPWQDQMSTVFGPTSTYTVEYDLYHVGVAWKLNAEDILKLTLDTSYIPYAKAIDEDNHIRRGRVSQAECTGTGSMLSMSLLFALGEKWYISSSCTKLHVSADGNQKQIWYANDPATPSYDDTGQALTGIDDEIRQDSFHLGISVGCKL